MNQTNKHMSKELKTLRKKLDAHVNKSGLSYYKVAQAVDMVPQTLYAFRDGGKLNAVNFMKLMEYLKIDLEKLK